MIFIFSVVVIFCCAMFGRLLFIICGINNLSIMGASFVLGYGLFGFILLLSLKYLGSPMIGALIFFGLLGAMTARQFYYSKLIDRKAAITNLAYTRISILTKSSLHKYTSQLIKSLIAVVLVSWVIAISLVFAPMCWLTIEIKYFLPEIFDLPKHLFAINSLYQAKDWPPPNPFFSNEVFAYNFLFYFPVAFIAKLVNNPWAIFQSFPVVIIAIGIALPMLILDIVRNITQSKFVHLASVLLATWVGGLTPIWLENKQGMMGASLVWENLVTSPVWVDELFVYIIYIPQHVFAVLCGLVAVFILANIRFAFVDYLKVFLAGIATLAGSLSSLILLPHLVVSFFIVLIIMFLLQWRALGYNPLKTFFSPIIIIALLLPLFLGIPFVIEILKWSSGTGSMTTVPENPAQWFYVFSAIGMVVPLAIVGLRVFKREEVYGIDLQGGRTLISISVMVIVGLIGVLFGGYPDAGLKSGLLVRIALVPLASIGFLVLIRKDAYEQIKVFATVVVTCLFFGIAIINYPIAKDFILSAWRPMDPGVKIFINYIRSLPEHSRFALFSSEQVLVALVGRQIDFDFSSNRTDSYMPLDGRLRAKRFWDGVTQNDAEIWSALYKKYDYLIAPIGSPVDVILATKLHPVQSIGRYNIYKSSME